MFRWLAKHKAVGLSAVVGVGLASLAAVAWAQEPPTIFRETVRMVRVIASVKNAKGDLVGTLQRSDFKIFDNGVEQEIAAFERQSSTPLSIAMMIDASGSTLKDIKYETDSAAKFLHALLSEGNPEDAVALYKFDADVTPLRYFTHNYASLENALRMIHGNGGTSIYDAVYLGAQELENRQGRKVLIIISDGGNTTSTTDIQRALKRAQLADAVIYPVVVLPITNEAGRNIGGEHSLIYMAERTGGRTFFPAAAKELDKAFAEIITELRTQYSLAYYPKNIPLTKDPFHRLEVKLASPDLRVSARNGYYGDAESASGSPGAQITVTPAERKKKK